MIECQVRRVDVDSNCKVLEGHVFYSFHDSPFGRCLIAFVEDKDGGKLVCHLAFADGNEAESEEHLRGRFPGARFHQENKRTKQLVDRIFYEDQPNGHTCVRVLLKGTDFQMDVWEYLTKIPMGTLTTYGQVAEQVGKPKAARAVGSALKANEIVYLIPCHRVICKSGSNKFSCGVQRKLRMQDYEKNYVNQMNNIDEK